jgi:hypothetical protein
MGRTSANQFQWMDNVQSLGAPAASVCTTADVDVASSLHEPRVRSQWMSIGAMGALFSQCRSSSTCNPLRVRAEGGTSGDPGARGRVDFGDTASCTLEWDGLGDFYLFLRQDAVAHDWDFSSSTCHLACGTRSRSGTIPLSLYDGDGSYVPRLCTVAAQELILV